VDLWINVGKSEDSLQIESDRPRFTPFSVNRNDLVFLKAFGIKCITFGRDQRKWLATVYTAAVWIFEVRKFHQQTSF